MNPEDNSPIKIRWWNVIAIGLIAIGGSVVAFRDASSHRNDISIGLSGISSMVISSSPDALRGHISDAMPSIEYNSTYNTIWTNNINLLSILTIVCLLFFISIAIFYMRCCA